MSHPLDAMRALERLLHGLAHDLSNPLSAVIGYTQLAAIEADPARRAKYLDAVLSQAAAIKASLNDLQLAATTAPAQRESVALGDVVALAAMGTAARVEGTASFEVKGDRDALVTALRKLIDNAGPTAVVRVVEGGLEVQDDGPGFTAEALLRGCEPSFTTRRTGNGVGLGLPVALAVAERHGGTLELSNRREGGALVRLMLPRP